MILFTRFTFTQGHNTNCTELFSIFCLTVGVRGSRRKFSTEKFVHRIFHRINKCKNAYVFFLCTCEGDPLKQRLWRRRDKKWYTIGGIRVRAIRDLIHDRHSYICVSRINIIDISIEINSHHYGSMRKNDDDRTTIIYTIDLLRVI